MVIIKKAKGKKFRVSVLSGGNNKVLNVTEAYNSRQACIKAIVSVMKVFNSGSVDVQDESYASYKLQYTLLPAGSKANLEKVKLKK